jgi:HEAT repeat protein
MPNRLALTCLLASPLLFCLSVKSQSGSVEELLRKAKSDAASERLGAARQLGDHSFVKDESARKALFNLLQDPQWFVRLQAADSLTERAIDGDMTLLEPLSRSLESESNPAVREHISAALAKLQATIDFKLCSLKDPDPKNRLVAAMNLHLHSKSDEKVARGLVAALEDPDREVRRAVVMALDWSQFPFVVDALLFHLEHDPDQTVRAFCAQALGDAHDARAVEPLIAHLEEPGVGLEALRALGKIGDPRSVPSIVGLLGEDSMWAEASGILAHFGDTALASIIAELKSGKTETSRSHAAQALESFKTPEAVTALTVALHDSSPRVRSVSALTIGHIGGAKEGEVLLPALDDASAEVRTSAAIALGWLHYRGAVRPLLLRVKDTRNSNEGNAAIGALGDIGSPDAVPALIQILRNQFASSHSFEYAERVKAAESLGKIGGQTADDFLFAALASGEQTVFQGAYSYFIAAGKEGSEDLLIAALERGADYSNPIAEAFAESTNKKLAESAHAWAQRKGVSLRPTGHPVIWGSHKSRRQIN